MNIKLIARLVVLIGATAVLGACKMGQSTADTKLLIHHNQVAYAPKASKSFVVSVAKGIKVSSFEVVQDGKTILAQDLIAVPDFTEWGDRDYFQANFSRVDVEGLYTLKVATDMVDGVSQSKSIDFEVAKNALFIKTMPKVLAYFKANRYLDAGDRHINIYGSDKYVDVWGGWMDAGGDTGKYLSHLAYSNFLTPQQGAIVSWVLAKSYESIPDQYEKANLEVEVLEETLWGADYLHRILDESGFFYMTVFDQWGSNPERVVTGYTGADGIYTENYQAAYREGGGIAIAALARAYGLSQTLGKKLNIQGEFTAEQYLDDAERAFSHLQVHNSEYCDNGKENIIDDYTALIAATELYRVTQKPVYLQAMNQRADNLNNRITNDGWFISDNDSRPFYHGVEAGMPIIALVDYLNFSKDEARIADSRATIKMHLDYQIVLNTEVANPFNYARQTFKSYSAVYGEGVYSEQTTGFFIPHKNESEYWWQGENARLASLSAASIWGGQVSHAEAQQPYGIKPELADFAQNQMDWILGRNPYDICMLYGFGKANPPYSISGGAMVVGGISNGITGATKEPMGRGITWAEGPDDNDWRWVEQWLQHSSWYVLGVTAMTEQSQ